MTTSLAALASTPSAHSSSTVLMSTTSATNSHVTAQANSPASSMLIESAEYDANQEIKCEFYTREGLWKLVKHGEFVRQQQSSYQQTPMSSQLNNGTSQLGNSSQTSQTTSNEPVKLAYFKYSNDLLFQHNAATNNSMRLKMQHKDYCLKCMKIIISSQQRKLTAPTSGTNRTSNNLDHDDDDDIVYYNETATPTNQDDLCKYCNSKINSNDSLSTASTISNSNVTNSSSCPTQSLDILVFNYAREIYFYEFNLFKSKSPSDMKNLIDKKAYRSFVSTCFDINSMASNLNTIDLQNKSVLKTDPADSSSNSTANNNSNNNFNNASNASINTTLTTTNTNTKLNLSPNYLSLILAAGFGKGEIHVFDGFKKEASVFYNNTKFVDKTKVTCIKWLPNSMNLFLAGYSSGNIYLYDANNQTQPNAAPVFTKLYQDESFSVHINNHANNTYSNSTTSSTAASSTNSTPSNTIKNTKSTSNGYPVPSNNSASSFNSFNDNSSTTSTGRQEKLVLLSSNQQQPVQVAKNPLLKWTIGASNSSADPSSSSVNPNEQVFYNSSSNYVGVNGVNEFAFSPCGLYLAIVSQDGYMRVFSFSYQSNQQLHIQLLGSMKSYFGGLLCVTWSSDGKYIATGGEDDLITIFSFADMRVACRGRGHSSWINCCAFDPWTTLNSPSLNESFYSKSKTTTTNSKFNGFHLNSKTDENDESDLEDYHATSAIKNLNKTSQLQQFAEQKKLVASKKNRTISTLSDINYNPNLSYSNENSSSSIYYRLASCGQDNQICFWDLTEECLKEKIPHSRSRITSINHHHHQHHQHQHQQQLPQIIIQPSELLSESNKLVSEAIQQQQHHQTGKEHHHHSTSSFVSTARSLFSLKHNNVDSKSKSKQANDITDLSQDLVSSNPTHKNGGLSLTSTFFKKHKRNASLTNTTITNGLSENGSNLQTSKTKANKNTQVTLNSYKKSSNTINLVDNIQQINVDLQSKMSISNASAYNTKHTTFSANDTKTMINSTNTTFNLCPKLDEIPMIEPLICKRIANERLTSVLFREDCFMVSTQDGYVFTWARPNSSTNNNNTKNNNPLPQLVEFKANTTTSL